MRVGPVLPRGWRLGCAAGLIALWGCAARPSRPARAPESCPSLASIDDCKGRLEALERALAETLQTSRERGQPAGQSLSPSPQNYGAEEMSSAGPRVEEQAASSAAARDCDAAHDLRDRICELAAAICELAARNPEADELARRCEAARATCEHAKTDVATACGE